MRRRMAGIVVTPERLGCRERPPQRPFHSADAGPVATGGLRPRATSSATGQRGVVPRRATEPRGAAAQDSGRDPASQGAGTSARNSGPAIRPTCRPSRNWPTCRRASAAETGRVGSSLQVANQIGSARVAQLAGRYRNAASTHHRAGAKARSAVGPCSVKSTTTRRPSTW